MSKIKIRNSLTGRQRVTMPVITENPHPAQQEFKKDLDINQIMRRLKNGQNPPSWMTSATPRYGDFANMPASFMEAFDIVERAEAAFASLPLEFRRDLDHDPRNLQYASKELYAKHKLLKPEGADSAAPEAPASPPADLSPKGSTGSKKGVQKPQASSEEEA